MLCLPFRASLDCTVHGISHEAGATFQNDPKQSARLQHGAASLKDEIRILVAHFLTQTSEHLTVRHAQPKMGCEAEEYLRFWRMAKDFRYLDQMQPASLRREMMSFGVAQPMLHLARCRPVGLLFLLVKVDWYGGLQINLQRI